VTLADQDPQDPSRENMLVYLGWLEKAAQQYSEVLAIAPGHREAREKLAIAQKNAAIVRKHLGSDRP